MKCAFKGRIHKQRIGEEGIAEEPRQKKRPEVERDRERTEKGEKEEGRKKRKETTKVFKFQLMEKSNPCYYSSIPLENYPGGTFLWQRL